MADTASLQETMRQLEANVAHMRKLIDEQAAVEVADQLELKLPPEIRVPRREVVATYLGRHRDMLDIVSKFGVALVNEFNNEPAEIELDQYDDPEIDDHYLTFTVRLPAYPDDGRSLMDRLDRVSDALDDQFSSASGEVLVTSDFRPLSVS